jgi:predicted dehydrogenase
VSSNAKLRVGQVGLGYWGRNLARVFDDVANLTWLCDASDALREEFGHRYPNARVTGDFEEMISSPDLDAVVIATPVPTHYPLTRAALEAGKHVFVEKPPAMRVSEMEELIGLAESGGLVLMPGHLLYHPAVQKLKELVDSASSARCSSCTATARTSARSARTRTRSGRSACTTSR